jgi:radical SAM superfamily enzyme YgiQ (UPF0313 family)
VTWQVRALAQQILGRESGTIHKDWGGRLPVALVFPNSYYVGMSSLALQSLYRWFNSRDDIVCERIFLPPTKGGSRQAGLQFAPLALESQRPLDDFAVLAIHLSFEMDAFHLLQMLRAAGIPLRSADRDEVWPLLVAGGPAVSANPEPLAPFLDAVFVGEIEERIDALLDALHLAPDGHPAALAALARVPGIYIPAYHTEGSRVQRQWTADLDAWPAHTVAFTPDTEFGDMGLLEIARGCERGCRFCLAGTVYRPRRERSVDNLLAQARWLLTHRERLGLVSAAVSDHSQIDTLAPRLLAHRSPIAAPPRRPLRVGHTDADPCPGGRVAPVARSHPQDTDRGRCVAGRGDGGKARLLPTEAILLARFARGDPRRRRGARRAEPRLCRALPPPGHRTAHPLCSQGPHRLPA